MSIEVGAVYENSSLKLDRALPLEEHQRVKITIDTESSIMERNYGIIGWTGDVETIRKIALDPEYGIQESP